MDLVLERYPELHNGRLSPLDGMDFMSEWSKIVAEALGKGAA